MRFFSVAVAAFGLLMLPGGSIADFCADEARTQLDVNYCAADDFKHADDELNALYGRILSEYADDSQFIAKFRAAQRAWLKFRDAEMEALFPHGEEAGYYGSVYPMCQSRWLKVLTEERIAQLRKWSGKAEEGDVCSGSIKWRE